jgi:hypothetical protein
LNNSLQKERFGGIMRDKLKNVGINYDYLESGEGDFWVDNEAGRALAAKHSTTPAKQPYPAWAKGYATSAQQVKKVVEMLGGIQQTSQILGTPYHELEEAMQGDDAPFQVLRDCAQVGFSLDWLAMAMGKYYSTSDEGTALRTAIETDTLQDYVTALFRKSQLVGENALAPRTIGGRMGLVRIWTCEYFEIPDTAASWARYLTHHPHNTEQHIFTAEEVQEWEADRAESSLAVNIAIQDGFDMFWLMLGAGEGRSIFQSTEAGNVLAEWYAKREPSAKRVEMA